MAKTASEQLIAINKKYNKIIPDYLKSKEFELVAKTALKSFIDRVKRGFMPDMSKIPDFTSDAYFELRNRYKANLGRLGKVKKSNATATGQMIDSMLHEVTRDGFFLYVSESTRKGELNGSPSKLTNAEVAAWYNLNRNIFDFSKPETQRIIRLIRSDLTKLFTKPK